MPRRAEEILKDWFGPLDEHGCCAAGKIKRWFEKDPEFDAWLRAEYGEEVERALASEYEETADLRASVAKILLLDQFTRNVFRDSPRMFAGDARALSLSRHVLNHPDRDELPLMYQAFACMPLMHAENLEAQEQCVREFERLAKTAPEPLAKVFEGNLDYAHRHRDIIARFGRFPHRNANLQRETTDEEAVFLNTPGSSF